MCYVYFLTYVCVNMYSNVSTCVNGHVYISLFKCLSAGMQVLAFTWLPWSHLGLITVSEPIDKVDVTQLTLLITVSGML